MGLYQDASNADFPEARVNLGITSKDLVIDFGADPAGVLDATLAIKAALEHGGDLDIPSGRYLIAAAGPNAGGVTAVITKSISVKCAADVEFYTDDLDNDFIAIRVPTNGVGIDPDGMDFTWRGGRFNQRAQRCSVSVPFRAQYPPVKQGASSTCDGLSIGATHTNGEQNGIRRCELSGITFDQGDHWQTSGGDSGIIASGADVTDIHHCTFKGCRDLGIYSSGGGGTSVPDVEVTATGRVNIWGCDAWNCFGAFASKRSLRGVTIRDNTMHNCVIGIFATHHVGPGVAEHVITGNAFYGCRCEVRLARVTNSTVRDNHGQNYGAFLADGITPVDAYQAVAYWLDGVQHSVIEGNSCMGVNPLYVESTAFIKSTISEDHPGFPPQPCMYNRIANNWSNGFDGIATEEVGGLADFIQYDNNYDFADGGHHPISFGVHNSLKAYDWEAGRPIHYTPVSFAGGDATNPIMRLVNTTNGFYFSTQNVGITNARLTLWTTGGASAAGTDQATAYNMQHQVARIAGVSPAASGVRLPPATAGMVCWVVNDDASDVLNLYPEVGESINALAANSAIALPATGGLAICVCGLAGKWTVKVL